MCSTLKFYCTCGCMLNQFWWLHLPWHIICSIKSFSWRAWRLAFVKWTIWRVCLTTPLQRTDKWFWFSCLKGQIHHFFSSGNFHDTSLWERHGGDGVMCLYSKRHGTECGISGAELALSLLSWISSHPVHQSYQPEWRMDHWRSHCHHHRGQLLWWPTSCVWHHARMEWGMMEILL